MTLHEALREPLDELAQLCRGEHCSIFPKITHSFQGKITEEYRIYVHGYGFLGGDDPYGTIDEAMAAARAIFTGPSAAAPPSTDVDVDALVAKLEEQKAPR